MNSFCPLESSAFQMLAGIVRSAIALILLAGSFCAFSPAYARIVRIEITHRQSPTFEGRTFGRVGVYEKLRGRAYGEIDPKQPQNSLITDITLAPRNRNGMVEYAMDIYILKPVDLSAGSHKLFLEVNNRGGKLFGGLNTSRGGNDPTTAADAGDAFLMNRGYTLVWNGWDISATADNNNLTITVPVATQSDGSPLTGPSYEYIVFDNPTARSYKLAYPTASLDKSKGKLTVRNRLNDAPKTIGPDGWEYIDDHSIRLLPAGTAFQQSAIYEFVYTAKNPLVAGLGLAATRDFISFLRYAQADEYGHANPLAADVQYTFSYALSQPARYLNDFQTLGFNADEQGRRVIDGMENWLGGSSGVAINYRFAQPSRTERNRQNHFFPEAIFPFAYPVLTDPFTGKTAGRQFRCRESDTCPKVFEINSANEYWVKAASLLHTDLTGNDLPDPENVRFFLIAGAQHGTGNATNRGICQQLQNPTNAEPVLRALFIALEEWVTRGIKPPESKVPRRANRTAAMAIAQQDSPTGVVPQASLGWPSIPNVTYSGLVTIRYQLNFGPEFDKGILAQYPPSLTKRPVYACFVSKVDQDGNEIAGIRLPAVEAPIATTTGWALRRDDYGKDDGCESAGQYIPFFRTKQERTAMVEAGSVDPRLSLEERYQTHDGYVNAVRQSTRKLVQQRFLLEEDAQNYIREAEASSVLR
ncbi:alpha/beta hydrolase domain-containing protein [Spirosoma sp. SC4-14]|uniref:alpha/beta hydrolase domain-containing protein n=1 Tax=Spirosoma sp. SC4-14 TaxID=3128900 RepID=UPI0030CCC06E